MKIIIVRHAQTDENVGEGLANRESEVLLNEEGVKQAEKLGHHLKGHHISHAYSSPQKRAVHTAEHVLKHHPEVKLSPADELSEQRLGAAIHLSKAAWKEIKKNAKEPFHLFKAEGGESYEELQARVKSFFHELVKRHPNDTVLVVSHGGTLGVLLVHLLEKELNEENYRAHQPKNTEYTIIEIDADGRKEIHALNAREHLNGEA